MKKTTPTFNKLTTEQIQAAAWKKKVSTARAQAIVTDLLEPKVEEMDFLAQLPFINQSHYEDVIEERHILLLCSYPLCGQKLEKVPHQQYRISLAQKKVYDITERKKYCSGYCFKASQYIKEQMLRSPIWMRENEKIPDFKLLPKETKSSIVMETKNLNISDN